MGRWVGGGVGRDRGTRDRLIGSGGGNPRRWERLQRRITRGGSFLQFTEKQKEHVVEVSGGRGAELEAPGPDKGEPDVNTGGWR